MYSLKRERDGIGDSGGMSIALTYSQNDIEYEENARPRVGVAMRVGSHFGRSYSAQDWWQTTVITEILEERSVATAEGREDYVKFRTGNSVYEWRHFQ
jgi:hypothetical protein